MNKRSKISTVFPKHLFWDVDIDKLDASRDKALIIPRALFMSNESSFNSDIEKLEIFYSSAEIINNLKATRERISNKVCEMVADRYHIPIFHRYPLR